MTRLELIERVAEAAGLSKAQAVRVVDLLLDAIAGALGRGEEVRLTGFGSFRVAESAARQGRNPRTGAAVALPARRSARFKAGLALRQALNGGPPPE